MTHALDLLAQAVLMAVVALGAWTAMGDGMILAGFRKWVERSRVFPAWIRNPVASCPRCMCSVWGIAALWVFGFGVGIDINFVRDSGLMHFDEHYQLVHAARLPFIVVDWSRLAELPALILAAVGIQELLHRQ